MFAALATAASATTISNYYGFNYLTSSSPTCNAVNGEACSGFEYRDWTGITKNSGDCMAIAFRDAGDTIYFTDPFLPGLQRHELPPHPHISRSPARRQGSVRMVER